MRTKKKITGWEILLNFRFSRVLPNFKHLWEKSSVKELLWNFTFSYSALRTVFSYKKNVLFAQSKIFIEFQNFNFLKIKTSINSSNVFKIFPTFFWRYIYIFIFHYQLNVQFFILHTSLFTVKQNFQFCKRQTCHFSFLPFLILSKNSSN